MPIAKKKTAIKASKVSSSKAKTPRITPAELGIDEDKLEFLHEAIERAKLASDTASGCEVKRDLQDAARKRIFGGDKGAFRVELRDGKTLLLKPSTRQYPLTDEQAARIEEIIESAGFDAGDYYHESHAIEIDANTIYGRLGDDEYMRFQAALGRFLSTYTKEDGKMESLGDCWSMKETIIARPNFHESRFELGKRVNLKIEDVKPMTISVEAKREI
jgi:hypothetical protein